MDFSYRRRTNAFNITLKHDSLTLEEDISTVEDFGDGRKWVPPSSFVHGSLDMGVEALRMRCEAMAKEDDNENEIFAAQLVEYLTEREIFAIVAHAIKDYPNRFQEVPE